MRQVWDGFLQEKGHKEKRYHPTQKPLRVMRWCIAQAPAECKTILDPFMGVGTTLLAAKLEGREAVGIEREERYCEIAAKRLEAQIENDLLTETQRWPEPVGINH